MEPTGEAEFCVNGHNVSIVGRYASRGCKACVKDNTRVWHTKDPNKHRNYVRHWSLKTYEKARVIKPEGTTNESK
jgi:hypothetical protein